jgi:hypothetical protein
MKLYKLTTSTFDINGSPDIKTIKDMVDLQLDEIHLVKISENLKKFCQDIAFPPSNSMSRSLNSNDVFALMDKGHTIMYRESDDIIHWVIDLDHSNYIPLGRDLKLDFLIS